MKNYFLTCFLLAAATVLSAGDTDLYGSGGGLFPGTGSLELSSGGFSPAGDEFLYYREFSSRCTAEEWLQENRVLMEQLPVQEQTRWMEMAAEDLISRIREDFNRALSFGDLHDFQDSLEQLGIQATWQTLGDRILYDSAGDPLLRSCEGYDIAEDRKEFLKEAGELAEGTLQRWTVKAEALLSSFTASVPLEFRDHVEDALSLSLDSWYSLIQEETDCLIRWSTARMASRRREDHYSLRTKSEDLSAGSLADSLIQDIRDELNESREALQNITGVPEDGADELTPSDDWESLFRQEFSRGMEKWAEGEEAFLSARLKWELRAESDYREAEASWSEALSLFTKSREEWSRSMELLWQEGRNRRESALNARMEELSGIIREMESTSREELEKFAGQVKSAVALYRNGLVLMESVEKNIEQSCFHIRDCSSALERGSSAVRTAALRDELEFHREDLDRWTGFKERLAGQIESARSALEDLEAAAAGYDRSVAAETIDQDMDALRSRKDHWYREWMISEAVEAYALENSSLRDTEAESLEQYNRALRESEAAEAAFTVSMERLSRLRSNLVLMEGELASFRPRLDVLDEEMDQALENYEFSLNIYSNEEPQLLERGIADLNDALLEWYGGDEPGRQSLISEYLECAEFERRMNLGEEEDPLAEALSDLIGDSGSSLFKALEHLDSSDAFLGWMTPLVQMGLIPESMESLLISFGRLMYGDSLRSVPGGSHSGTGEALISAERVLDLADELEREDGLFEWIEREDVSEVLASAGWDGTDGDSPADALLFLEEYRRDLDSLYIRESLTEKLLSQDGGTITLGDEDFLEWCLNTAADFCLADSVQDTGYYSGDLKEQFLESRILMTQYAEKIKKLEEGMALCLEDRTSYYRTVVEPRFQSYMEIKSTRDELLEEYRVSSEGFDKLQKECSDAQMGLDRLYSTCREAEYELQEASEILDYARGIYSPEEDSIHTILAERREQYVRFSEALAVLEEIAKETDGKRDKSLSALVEEKSELLSTLNLLSSAGQNLAERLDQIQIQKRDLQTSLSSRARELVDFTFRDGLEFSYDPELLEEGMSSFNGLENGNISKFIDGYFSQTGSSEIFTRDLLLWMDGISEYGNPADLLKTFSFAYYHELREMEGMNWDKINSLYTVDLMKDPRHIDLLSTDGTFFTSVHIGYQGNWDKYQNGEYETVQEVIPFYQMVLISGEEWLKERCFISLFTMKHRSELKDLYNFYKILMYSDAPASRDLKSAMEKDLSRVAWKYIDSQAKTQQDKFKRKIFGGYRKKGRDIRDKRHTLAVAAAGYSGISGRNLWGAGARSISGSMDKLGSLNEELLSLSMDSIKTTDQFFALLGKLGCPGLTDAMKNRLTGIFGGLSQPGESSPAATLSAVNSELEALYYINSRSITRRREELEVQKRLQKSELQNLLAGDSWDAEAYRRGAEICYLEQPYCPGTADGDILSAVLEADGPQEFDSLYTVESYGQALIDSFRNRLSAVAGSRITGFQAELDDLVQKGEYWETHMKGISREGLRQWNLAWEKMVTDRDLWRRRVEAELNDKSALWENRYEQFRENRDLWIERGTEILIDSSAEGLARDWDLEADRLMSSVDFRLVTDLSLKREPAENLVYRALKGGTLAALIAEARRISFRDDGTLLSPAPLPVLPDSALASLEIRESNVSLKDDVLKAVSLTRAAQLLVTAGAMETSINEALARANNQVDDGIDEELGNAGYVRRNNLYSRVVLIDSSLIGGNEMEDQSLEAYRALEAPAFAPDVNLTKQHLARLDGVMIQASVELLQDELTGYMQTLFGNGEENTAEESLFQKHLGFAPEMDEDDPEKVIKKGSGEYGRIFEKYFIHQARLYRGLATVNAPWYSQKLWDDDSNNDGESDGFLGAPSVRTLVDIGMNAVACILTSGVGNVVLNILDDCLFAIADSGRGILDPADAALGLIKKAGSGMVSAGIGELGSLVDSTIVSSAGVVEVLSDTAVKGFSYTASTYSSAAISSFDFDGGWDMNRFNSMTGWDNLGVGALTAMAGTGVTETINLGSFGFIGEMGKQADSFSNLTGGLAASGLEYALTGETVFNVLNMGAPGSGILELNIGGDGSSLNFGTGGTDIAMNTLYSSALGLSAFGESMRIRGKVEDRDLRPGMRTLISAGYDETTALYQDIMEGRVVLNTGNGESFQGKTTVDDSGAKVLDLNTTGMSRLDIAVLLGHEAFRDGVVGNEAVQNLETADAVTGHMAIASALRQRYGMEYLNSLINSETALYQLYSRDEISSQELTEYIDNNYDSSEDFWKVIVDDQGEVLKVLDDGDRYTIIFTGEDGEVKSINRADGSLSGQIARIAGESRPGTGNQSKADINRIMVNSGLDYAEGRGWFAIDENALDPGPVTDPVYEAIRRNDYSYLAGLGRNSTADLSQELVEKTLGLDEHSACALTAAAEYANNYFQSEYGRSLDNEGLLRVLEKAEGEMFDEESTVLSYNGLNAFIAAELDLDNYPVLVKTTDSLEELTEKGIDSYLQKFTHLDDEDRKHFISWSNGVVDDPYTTFQEFCWWENVDICSTEYYVFQSKY